jgi:acyl-CoA thioesterase-1
MIRLAALVAVLLAVAAAPAAAAEPVRLVVLGDSLTAGYGLPPGAGFPARLEAALRERGRDVTVVDAGVSGDTTAGGLSRLDWSVGADAQAVIVELGGNDMLRGIDPARTAENLDKIVGRLTGRGLPVLVAGMRAPRNLGEAYGDAFDALFPAIAERHGASFYPFFLDGVAADPTLNLPDGIHPNEAGIAIIVERILPAVEQLLDRVGAS